MDISISQQGPFVCKKTYTIIRKFIVIDNKAALILDLKVDLLINPVLMALLIISQLLLTFESMNANLVHRN